MPKQLLLDSQTRARHARQRLPGRAAPDPQGRPPHPPRRRRLLQPQARAANTPNECRV
jgi:hypothetical protein